jgi:putative spermidine/putrescine transport system permease protein/spermidine/putrescine transport system permease protein
VKARAPLLDGALAVVTACAFIGLYAPLLAVSALSFFQIVRVRGVIGFAPFSLEPYSRLLVNGDILSALSTTMLVGAVATAISLGLGFFFASYMLTARRSIGAIVQALIFLPFLLPPIITGLALLIAFRQLDIARSIGTIVVGHVVFIIPIVYRTILVRLQLLGRSLTEASLDLGASRWQTLRYVVLPQMRPALIAAGLLAFSMSFDETLITLFLAGSEATLPIRLWGMMRVGFVPEINALATLILVFAAAVTLGVGMLQRAGNQAQ